MAGGRRANKRSIHFEDEFLNRAESLVRTCGYRNKLVRAQALLVSEKAMEKVLLGTSEQMSPGEVRVGILSPASSVARQGPPTQRTTKGAGRPLRRPGTLCFV